MQSAFRMDAGFPGGNIRVLSVEGDRVFVAPDLRDTADDWFYWCFRVTGAAGRTLTFDFGDKIWVGYYGAAVSHDGETWRWQSASEVGEYHSFSYSFAEDENEVYFAHDIPYRPERFFRMADELGMDVKTFCRSEKGRDVPCVSFGTGEKLILLTSRHHACESTGSFVLEGVLRELFRDMPRDWRVFCVPFIDYDGVLDGDQGKHRSPHDHYDDYIDAPIYASIRAITAYARENLPVFGFDFHAPWHMFKENDVSFFVMESYATDEPADRFGAMLEDAITPDSLPYHRKNNIPTGTKPWNKEGLPGFPSFLSKIPGVRLTFALETPYFGKEGGAFTSEKGVAFGRCFASALRRYIASEN